MFLSATENHIILYSFKNTYIAYVNTCAYKIKIVPDIEISPPVVDLWNTKDSKNNMNYCHHSWLPPRTWK